MKASITSALILIMSVTFALAENINASLSDLPVNMGERGTPIQSDVLNKFAPNQLRDALTDIPTAQLAKIAGQRISDAAANTRSAKDAEIYRAASPAVVLI